MHFSQTHSAVLRLFLYISNMHYAKQEPSLRFNRWVGVYMLSRDASKRSDSSQLGDGTMQWLQFVQAEQLQSSGPCTYEDPGALRPGVRAILGVSAGLDFRKGEDIDCSLRL